MHHRPEARIQRPRETQTRAHTHTLPTLSASGPLSPDPRHAYNAHASIQRPRERASERARRVGEREGGGPLPPSRIPSCPLPPHAQTRACTHTPCLLSLHLSPLPGPSPTPPRSLPNPFSPPPFPLPCSRSASGRLSTCLTATGPARCAPVRATARPPLRAQARACAFVGPRFIGRGRGGRRGVSRAGEGGRRFGFSALTKTEPSPRRSLRRDGAPETPVPKPVLGPATGSRRLRGARSRVGADSPAWFRCGRARARQPGPAEAPLCAPESKTSTARFVHRNRRQSPALCTGIEDNRRSCKSRSPASCPRLRIPTWAQFAAHNRAQSRPRALKPRSPAALFHRPPARLPARLARSLPPARSPASLSGWSFPHPSLLLPAP